MKKPLRIALTGGVGSGKSLVLKILRKKGVPVLQTDLLGHRLLKEAGFRKALVLEFGKGILGPRGSIDRRKLGERVFRNPRERRKLNERLHPAIRERVAQWITRQARRGVPPDLVVVEVPLLFERGYHRSFDGSLCVSSPAALRRERLGKRGWSPEEVRRREKSQWSPSRKARAADWVISNRGTQKELEYAVGRWLGGMRHPGSGRPKV